MRTFMSYAVATLMNLKSTLSDDVKDSDGDGFRSGSSSGYNSPVMDINNHQNDIADPHFFLESINVCALAWLDYAKMYL